MALDHSTTTAPKKGLLRRDDFDKNLLKNPTRSCYSTPVLAGVILTLVVHAAVALGLGMWARYIARKHGGWWTKQVRVPTLGLTSVAIGMVIGFALLTRSKLELDASDGANKATQLAEGISSALHWCGLFVLVGWLLFAITLVICIVGTALRPRTAMPGMRVVRD